MLQFRSTYDVTSLKTKAVCLDVDLDIERENSLVLIPSGSLVFFPWSRTKHDFLNFFFLFLHQQWDPHFLKFLRKNAPFFLYLNTKATHNRKQISPEPRLHWRLQAEKHIVGLSGVLKLLYTPLHTSKQRTNVKENSEDSAFDFIRDT